MKTTKARSGSMLHALYAMVFLICGAMPGAASGAAAAIVTDLQGSALITDGSRSRNATILSDLETGARVQLDAGSTLVALYLEGGSEYVFRGPASIVFALAQPEVVSGAKPEKR